MNCQQLLFRYHLCMNTNELRQTFDQFDRDGNGVIDFGEFSELLNALGSEMEEEERRIGFDIIDVDRGGTIDFGEFAAWWDDQD